MAEETPKGPFVLRFLSDVPTGLEPGKERVAKFVLIDQGHGGKYLLSTGNSTPKLQRAKVFSSLQSTKSINNGWLCEVIPVDITIR